MNVVHYTDLTWPEVAQLPHDWPLIIPLGLDEYNLGTVARHLKADNLVLLPGIPYGFRRKDNLPLGLLNVRPGLLRRVLLGIQRELKAQGFQQVIFLNGHGDQAVRPSGLELLDIAYTQTAKTDFPKNSPSQIAVISTGHTEQHGYHLPLSTDSLIVAAIADELRQRAPEQVYCLPVWPYGVSTHSRQFAGTLNLGGRVFEDFFLAIVARLVELNFEMIYFSNGHGGNHSFIVNVVKYAGERHPQAFIASQWLHTTGPALVQHRQSGLGGMGHGGELETSYILHLRPKLVHMQNATSETDFINTPNYYMDWVEGGSLIANPPWSDDTTSGIYGDALLASALKGRLWLEAAIEEKLAIFEEIREQHERRKTRRDTRLKTQGDSY